MFGPKWQLSPRSYDLDFDLDVSVPLSDSNRLSGMLFRPKTDEQVPAILGFHPYSNEYQIAPVMPIGFGLQRGWMEAGAPRLFARCGDAHGTFNVLGTGKPTGQPLGDLLGTPRRRPAPVLAAPMTSTDPPHVQTRHAAPVWPRHVACEVVRLDGKPDIHHAYTQQIRDSVTR
jgi:hypothetical protein